MDESADFGVMMTCWSNRRSMFSWPTPIDLRVDRGPSVKSPRRLARLAVPRIMRSDFALPRGMSCPERFRTASDQSDLSAVIVRTLEGPDAVRVRFNGETIRVDAGDRWTSRVTAQLASKNSQAFTSTVLHRARLTPNEGAAHYRP